MQTAKLSRIAIAGAGTAMASGGALAHTFGIGVAPGEAGAVNVWWQAWHDCGDPNFEGSVQIEGIDGTSYGPETVLFTLTSCDENDVSIRPTFLTPTDAGQLCTVDAGGNFVSTGYVSGANPQASLGYDVNDPILAADLTWPDEYGGGVEDIDGAYGAVLCTNDSFATEEDFKWQGAPITGLSAGKYRVTYLDCTIDGGDASDCYDGSEASVDFEANDALTVSAVVEISSDLAPPARPAMPVPVMSWLGSLALALMTALAAGLRLRRRSEA